MPERPLPQGRFDPAVHQPDAYIAEGSKDGQNLRENLVLGSYFTNLAQQFYDQALVQREGRGLLIPMYFDDDYANTFPSRAPVVEATRGAEKRITQMQDFLPFTLGSVNNCIKSRGHDDAGNLTIATPIGRAYGRRYAAAITDATVALYGATSSFISKEDYVTPPYHRVIAEKTFFGDPYSTMVDSINSFGQAVTLLTAHELIPGFEEKPIDLVQALIDAKTFQILAAHLSFGMLAGLNHSGLYLKGLVDPKTLRLTPFAIRGLDIIRDSKREDSELGPRSTFEGCPVARQNTPIQNSEGVSSVVRESGVNLVGKVFLEYLRHFYEAA